MMRPSHKDPFGYYYHPPRKRLSFAIIADSTDITIDDLYRVADAHASSIARSARGDRGLLIIDTDIHITRSYARHFFGTDLEVDDVVVQANRADLYLYLEKDVPYVQDSTRLPREERDALDASHRAVLADAGIRFVVIRGSWDKRFASAVQAVETLLRTA
ncbi:MAG: hypothetical protein EOO38_10990 [Cytophagaceae bacterium]|nr:MAG: hypothetical protein EOO38_10990 [Cytophagaceae bacterium]